MKTYTSGLTSKPDWLVSHGTKPWMPILVIKFSEWIKIKEQTVAAPSPAAPAPVLVNAAPGSETSALSGTMSSDVRPVPRNLFSSKKPDCNSCSKDFKNWYYKNRRRKHV